MARFGFSLRNRRTNLNVRQIHSAPPQQQSAAGSTRSTSSSSSPSARSSWPSPTKVVLQGPQLLFWRGPRLLLRAPGAVLRAPGYVRGRTGRLFSSSRVGRRQELQSGQHGVTASSSSSQQQQHKSTQTEPIPASGSQQAPRPGSSSAGKKPSFTSRLRQRWSSTPVKWSPIPLSLGAAVLVAVSFYKQQRGEGDNNGRQPVPENQVKVQGPWQVHVIGALPLRSISRLYGLVNSYTLPVWFRVPGYKLYSWIFGVNLDECDPADLREYRSMSEFFMRRLKDGVRPIADAPLVSPADGKVVNFGTVEAGRVEQVKGSTYSLEALLSGTGQVDNSAVKPYSHKPHPQQAEPTKVDEKDFADLNGIHYSLDQLMGNDGTSSAQTTDASLSKEEEADEAVKRTGLKRSTTGDARVAAEVSSAPETSDGRKSSPWATPKPGHKLFFTVIYLAPGDYHRYHSPTNWVVERRRHFAGELFSVSPWMASKLQDLFVLNERVALLGRWRHGFFSMTPVGATNVGSIRVNFDSSLRTNSPLRPITPGTFSEATYAKASSLLGGQPLRSGDEIGGFWLGSTIVLVFEAKEDFNFDISMGQKVKMGEALGH